MEHQCKNERKPTSWTISYWDDRWQLSTEQPGRSTPVSFCPWCGVRLDAPAEPEGVSDTGAMLFHLRRIEFLLDRLDKKLETLCHAFDVHRHGKYPGGVPDVTHECL